MPGEASGAYGEPPPRQPMSRTFRAEYTSLCSEGDTIEVGQDVRYVGKALRHWPECPPEPVLMGGAICPRCFTQKGINDECGNCD